MTDSTAPPDDHVAAERARIQALGQRALERVQALEREREELKTEVEHLKQQLADYSVSIEVEAHLARIAGEWQRLYVTILGPEISICRASQDAEWGGPTHDDTHAHFEWIAFIRKFVDRAEHYGYHADFLPAEYNACDLPAEPERYEASLVHVAALAVAAIQSTRRKRELKEARTT